MGVHRVDSTGGNPTKGKFSSLAKKRLVRFVTLYPKALVSDDVEVVHNLRVASRRLQQVLQLILPEAKSSARKKVLRTLRKVRRAFGPCRNLDVNLNLVRGRMEKTTAASVRQAWTGVQLWLEERRAGAIETGRAELRQHELVDLIDRLQSLLENTGEEAESMERLWERTKDASSEWRNALDTAKADPAVQRIHAFRIAGKKLRYRVELLGELGNSSVKPMIGALKSLQDNLGDWHDHAVLRDHVGEFMQRPGFMKDEPRMCRALLREMERDKQRDRALIPEIMMKAEKLSQDSMQFEPKEPTANDRQKDQ
ncbi:MAG TPA: CHAD domain-containing protein [Candidatus Binatia bacterium]|nr:CHAD domain-containing protein [Candidatus Binatia bacterium]